MTNPAQQTDKPTVMLRIIAILAVVFGIMTLVSGGNVIFGPEIAREQAGDYVPIIVTLIFASGFLYIVAGAGIWMGRDWAYKASLLITLATVFIALIFVGHIISGGDFEMRTVGALTLRTAIWLGISFALFRAGKTG